MRLNPANSRATTVARKWSPVPVRSVTSASAPGMAASIRCLRSSVVGISADSVAVATLRKALAVIPREFAHVITFTENGAQKVQEFLASQSADIQTAGLRV